MFKTTNLKGEAIEIDPCLNALDICGYELEQLPSQWLDQIFQNDVLPRVPNPPFAFSSTKTKHNPSREIDSLSNREAKKEFTRASHFGVTLLTSHIHARPPTTLFFGGYVWKNRFSGGKN